MAGGVGGLVYSVRGAGAGAQPSYNLYNSRGDVVAQTNGTGAFTWQASYEAFGTRTGESGLNRERHRANTKDEDPTGLLNEGMRYRDLETGVWLTRDPAGFVDGPNLYAYVRQNPWTAFDPHGLSGDRIDRDGFKWIGTDHHIVPRQVGRDTKLRAAAKAVFDDPKDVHKSRIPTTPEGHDYSRHNFYNAEVKSEWDAFVKQRAANGVEGLTDKQQVRLAKEFVESLKKTDNEFIKGFNNAVTGGPKAVQQWVDTVGKPMLQARAGSKAGTVVNALTEAMENFGGKIAKEAPGVVGTIMVGGTSLAEGKSLNEASKAVVMSATQADVLQGATEAIAELGKKAPAKRDAAVRKAANEFDAAWGAND